MGVLSDIIVADPSEAAAINAAEGAHLEQWPCLESRDIDPVKLGTLWQVLSGGSPDDVDAVSAYMMDTVLDQPTPSGPWVFLVPEPLTAALAALGDAAQAPVAERWAATEEFVLDRWQVDDVRDYLRELVARARAARESGKSLLLWMSL
jgi:hypothetical protein